MVTTTEMDSAREEFIETEADALLKTSAIDMFLGVTDCDSIIRALMSSKGDDLVSAQTRLNEAMREEAKAIAARLWTPTEQAFAQFRIEDHNVH